MHAESSMQAFHPGQDHRHAKKLDNRQSAASGTCVWPSHVAIKEEAPATKLGGSRPRHRQAGTCNGQGWWGKRSKDETRRRLGVSFWKGLGPLQVALTLQRGRPSNIMHAIIPPEDEPRPSLHLQEQVYVPNQPATESTLQQSRHACHLRPLRRSLRRDALAGNCFSS